MIQCFFHFLWSTCSPESSWNSKGDYYCKHTQYKHVQKQYGQSINALQKHYNTFTMQALYKELWQNTSFATRFEWDGSSECNTKWIHRLMDFQWRSIQISSGTSPPWKNEKQETCCNAVGYVTSGSSSSFISSNWNCVSFLDHQPLQVSWEMLPELTQSTCICSVGTATSKVFKYRSKSDTAANATPWWPQWVQEQSGIE